MMDIKAMKNIGIDRIAWDAVWRVYNETGDISNNIDWIKPLLKEHMDEHYYDAMLYALNNNYDIPHWWDSLSENQLNSKRWLVRELKNHEEDKLAN